MEKKNIFEQNQQNETKKTFDWKALELKFRNFTGRITRSTGHLFSLKMLVFLGILLYMQKNGLFQDYPAIDSFVGFIANVTNWFYQIVMNIINWLATLPLFQWISGLPF